MALVSGLLVWISLAMVGVAKKREVLGRDLGGGTPAIKSVDNQEKQISFLTKSGIVFMFRGC